LIEGEKKKKGHPFWKKKDRPPSSRAEERGVFRPIGLGDEGEKGGNAFLFKKKKKKKKKGYR